MNLIFINTLCHSFFGCADFINSLISMSCGGAYFVNSVVPCVYIMPLLLSFVLFLCILSVPEAKYTYVCVCRKK